jgi:hypothetical protein
MKKTLALVTMALLLSIVTAPGSLAAVKAGAACTKAGLTNITGGFKYTCVKKSGKLVWVKGAAVKASAKPSVSASAAAAGYTMEKVKANASATSCWTVIKGNVYNLTAWINQHPGGSSSIKSLCGVDGSSAFAAQHQGESKPESRLAGYLLGPLTK